MPSTGGREVCLCAAYQRRSAERRVVVRGCSHRHSPRAPPIQPTAPTYRAADTNTCVARLQRCACAVSSPRVATCACVAPVPARAGSRGKGKGKGKGTGSTGLSRRTTPSSGGSRGTRAAAPAPRLPAQRVSPNPGTLSRRSHPPNPASILGGEAVDGEAAGNVAASGAGGTSKESGDGEGEGSRSDHRGEGSGLGMAAGLPLHGHKVIIDGYRVGFRCRVHTLVSTLWLTVFSRVVDVAQGNISSRGTAGRSGGAYCGQGYTHCRPCVLCFCVRENRSSPDLNALCACRGKAQLAHLPGRYAQESSFAAVGRPEGHETCADVEECGSGSGLQSSCARRQRR